MSYTREYPNSITPNGSTVRQCLENDDSELKRILNMLSDIGAVSIASLKRQSILQCSRDSSGNPNFLTTNGLTAGINGAGTPLIMAFASGFSTTSGAVDALGVVAEAVAACWTLPANGTYHLYIERNSASGLLSYGYTDSAPVYAKTAPDAILNRCYYNTDQCRMYQYNGSSWAEKQLLFVATAVTGASAISSVTYDSIASPKENELKTDISTNGTASKLTTPRTIALSGDATGSATFDGSGDATIAAEVSKIGGTAISDFIKTLLDDGDAATARATLEANAQNCGGIVAASLTANGYVKFANGLILEWGEVNAHTGTTGTLTAPLGSLLIWASAVYLAVNPADDYSAPTITRVAGSALMWKRTQQNYGFRWFGLAW